MAVADKIVLLDDVNFINCGWLSRNRLGMNLQAVFAEVFAIPQSGVNDSLALRDIPSWDSMSHMLLIARVEETFRVEFTGDEIADFRTFGDVREALAQRRVT